MKTQLHGATAFYGVGNGEHAPGQPSVVFIHGSGMDHTVWLMPARHFARHGYNVVALDLPGHGGSEGPALTSIDAMSEWVNALLEDLGIGEAAIVGHSMGSLVALDFAARYPTRARSLALLGTSTPMPVSDVLLDAAKNDDRAAMVMANTWSHSAPGLMGGAQKPGYDLVFWRFTVAAKNARRGLFRRPRRLQCVRGRTRSGRSSGVSDAGGARQ